jgi:hypothetical protein
MPGRDSFQRAFVAFGYLLDRRGSELVEPLADPAPAALDLVQRLSAGERPERARVLAAELGRVASALEQRRLR